MVYKKSKIKVLLGPEREKYLQSNGSEQTTNEHASSRIIIRKPSENRNGVFETIGETHVYKRTRPFNAFKGKPTLERYPSNLELSGHKVENEDEKIKAKSARDIESARTQMTIESIRLDDMDKSGINKASARSRDTQATDDRHSPSLPKSRHGRAYSSASNVVSKNVLSDFGLRTSRTDTFSGHQRRRGASADLAHQLEESAERHIRTCQVAGNLKRSSRAQQSVQGLKNFVSPSHRRMAFQAGDRLRHSSFAPENNFMRSDSNLEKANVVPYMIQIRKNVGSVSRMKSIGSDFRRHPLPELSGRTLIVGTGIGLS
jgi:hypothetical protein